MRLERWVLAPNGRQTVAYYRGLGGQHTLVLWDLLQGRRLASLPEAPLTHLATAAGVTVSAHGPLLQLSPLSSEVPPRRITLRAPIERLALRAIVLGAHMDSRRSEVKVLLPELGAIVDHKSARDLKPGDEISLAPDRNGALV